MKGTLLGFTWNNIHSSSLGLVRVSGGSEFTSNLLPSFQDYTTDIPGVDGKYYYGSKFDQTTIDFIVAFNGLTDAQLRAIKLLFSDKGLNLLTFDELPYKSYKVHINGVPQISYNAFTENYQYIDQIQLPHNHTLGNSGFHLPAATALDKVYKGTINLSFISYNPYAITRTVYDNTTSANIKLKYADQFMNKAYVPEWKLDPNGGSQQTNVDYNSYNYNEWNNSLVLKNSTDEIVVGSGQSAIHYIIDQPRVGGVSVYNPGDIDTPFSVVFLFNNSSRIIRTDTGATVLDGFALSTSDSSRGMTVGAFDLPADEIGIRWNGKLQLLEGIASNGTLSGRIYNRYITSGNFFTIKKNELNNSFVPSGNLELINFTFGQEYTSLAIVPNSITIDYDYMFF